MARKAGFAHDHGNALEIEGGALTGRVRGDILDKEAKLRFLNAYAARHQNIRVITRENAGVDAARYAGDLAFPRFAVEAK